MKLKWLVGTLAIGFVLAGCTKETAMDNNETKKEEEKKEEIKIVEEKTYRYDAGITYSAVIKNESKKPLNVYDLHIDYVNKKGKTIQTDNSPSVQVAPYILKPGEKGYVSAEGFIDKGNPKDYNVKLAFPHMKPANDVMKLEVDKGSVKKGEDISVEETITHVTGTVTNSTKKTIQYIVIGAGMYGKNHEFIGTAIDSEAAELKPGQSTSFDSQSPEIPKEALDKVKSYKVSASTYFE